MDADEYQRQAERFDNHGPLAVMKETAAALGLAAEAGEVANEYERSLRMDERGNLRPLNLEKIRVELGDVLWNVARLASLNGWSIEDLMGENIEKLTKRYEEAGIHVGN